VRVQLTGLGVVAALVLAPHAAADPANPYVKLPSTICEADVGSVACQGVFPAAPVDPCFTPKCPEVIHMDQAVADADGTFKWRDANIGDPEIAGPGWFVLGTGQTYHVNGWTIQRNDNDGTTVTNDATGHGMAVDVLGDREPIGEIQSVVHAF
jgi:hypothetical protein